MKNLKPCPHCGGKAYLHGSYAQKLKLWFVNVRCDVCESQGKTFTTKENPENSEWSNSECDSAADAWNLRYPQDFPDDRSRDWLDELP